MVLTSSARAHSSAPLVPACGCLAWRRYVRRDFEEGRRSSDGFKVPNGVACAHGFFPVTRRPPGGALVRGAKTVLSLARGHPPPSCLLRANQSPRRGESLVGDFAALFCDAAQV